MSNNVSIPQILLASPEQQISSLIETSSQRECSQVIQVLDSLIEEGTINFVDTRKGSRIYLQEYLNKGKKSPPVHILHLSGVRAEQGAIHFHGPEEQLHSYSLKDFAKAISKLRQLQLVILSGIGSPDLIQHLLIHGVPRILTIRPDFQDSGVLRELYLQLKQGKTFDEAFGALTRLVAGHEIGLNFLEVVYDSKNKSLEWEGPERVPAAFNNGLVIRKNTHKGRKNWRLLDSPAPVTERKNQEENSGIVDLRSIRPPIAPPVGGHKGPAERPSERTTPRRKPQRKRPNKNKQPETIPLQFEDQEKKQRLKKIALVSLLGISILAFTSVMFPGIRQKIKRVFVGNPAAAWDCMFPENDDKYHVMVLPFQEHPTCSDERSDFKSSVFKKLQEMASLEGIPIKVKEQSRFQTCEMDQQQARDIAATCQAHLLIWGWYLRDTLSGREVLDLHFYSTNTSGERLFLDGTGGMRRILLDELDQNTDLLTQKVETVIYWAMAMRRMHKADYLTAIDLFKRISAESEEVQAMVSLMLTQCYDQAGQYDQALAYYSQLAELNPKDPKVYIDRAGILTRMESFDDALKDYNQALRLDRDNISALIGRGILYHKQEGYQRALADFGRVLKMNPGWAPVYLSRAETFISIHRFRDAMNDYNKAIQLRPGYAQAYYGRACLRESRGDLQNALADIVEALDANPGYIEALLFRGDVYTKRSEWEQALEAYSEVLKQQRSANAFHKRAYVYQRMGQIDKALTDLNRAVDLRPTLETAWFDRGLIHQAAQRYDQALADFDQVLRLQPGNSKAFCRKGEVWVAKGDSDSARHHFSLAMQMDPNDAEPYYQRSLLLLSEDNVQEALKDVEIALRKDPSRAESFLTRGRIHLKTGNKNNALKDFNRTIDLNPLLSLGYAYRGETHISLGNLRKAQADFEQAIAQGSLRPEAYIGLGDIYLERQNFEKALEKYDVAVQIAPQSPLGYLKRANYFFRFKQYEEALSNYNKSLELGGEKTADVFVNRGIIHTELGNPNQALADFNTVLQQHPDSAEIYCLRGLLYKQIGKVNKALDDFSQALKVDPYIPDAYYSRGILYQDLEEYDQAITAYSEAIDLNPEYADAYNKRGEVYFIQEQFDKSILDYNQAIAINPKHADAFNNRGNLTRKAGDFDRAIKDYSVAIRFDPYQADALYNRGFIYAMQKEYDAAISDITKSLEIKPEQGLRYGFLAKIYAQRQDDERFFANIELALQYDYPTMELAMDPAYKYYQNNPRFRELMENYQR
ncbi:MAG: tetratricopeptide repeat protein [Bacteroidota bacterium]